MANRLTVHSGTVRVPEETVYRVPDVERTETWNPVPHREILDAYGEVMYKNNIPVISKEYSLSTDGMNMFGVWGLDRGSQEIGWSIGIRNSMSKKFSFATCAGSRVFVCDNLAFSSDGQVVYRRHTGKLSIMELKLVLENKLGLMERYIDQFVSWHEELHDFHLTEEQIEHIAFEMFHRKLLPITKFHEYVDLVKGEDAVYEPSLFGVHGGATQVMRGSSLFNVMDRSDKLNAFIENNVKKEYFRA